MAEPPNREAGDRGDRSRAPGDRSAPDGREAEAGVTLIEVMVAMVILAFGLLAVAGMAGAVATQTRMGGNVTGQTAAGQDVLEELQTKGFGHPDLATGTSDTRQVTVNSRTYTVTYQVNSAGTNLKEVVAVVEGTRDLPPDTLRTMVALMSAPPPIP